MLKIKNKNNLESLIKPNFKRVLKNYIILTFAAIFFTFSIQIFVTIPGIFANGLGAFALVIIYLWTSVKNYFSIIYLILNIPLLIWSFKYNQKKFTYRTTYFLLIQSLFSIPFILIPSMQIMITDYIWCFDSINNLKEAIWPIIVIPTLGGFIIGATIGLCWKNGGSTAGFDILFHYFSTKKKISVGFLTKVIGYLVITISFIITFIFEQGKFQFLFIRIIGTFLFIQTNSITIDKVFPKYKKVEIQIYTNKSSNIEEYLKSNDFKHPYNKTIISTGICDTKIMFSSVVLLLEANKLVKVIGSLNSDAWIKIVDVKKVYGKFNTSFLENNF